MDTLGGWGTGAGVVFEGAPPPDMIPGTYQPSPGAVITLPMSSSYCMFLLHLPY